MKHASILAMVLTATAAIALADIAPEPLITGGATLTPRNAKDLTVALTEEVVDLTPSPQRNTVTAVFTLKNTGDKPATLDVGFVNFYGEALKDTAVEIDGKKQLAEVTRETLPSGPYKTITKCWLTWPMTFDKGQTRTVKVSYWVEMGRTRLITMTQLPKDVNDQVAPCCSGFVLRTGAAWLGNTSKGTFRLHYSDQVKKSLLTIQSPKDGWKYDEASNTDTLTLADFKPASAFGLGFGGGRREPLASRGCSRSGSRRPGQCQDARHRHFLHLQGLRRRTHRRGVGRGAQGQKARRVGNRLPAEHGREGQRAEALQR